MEFRDLKAQYQALRPRMDEAIASAVSSGRFIGGERVRGLEGRLAAYVGARHCVSCANGTDALQLVLMAWGVGTGDAVFVPDFTFFASGEVVAALGATPVFVDVRADTCNLDAASLEAAVRLVEGAGELRPAAVIAVDLFGLPADYPAIRAVCDAHGLRLLEDGAQGFGGTIAGARACSFGDASTTSFFPAKPLGCYGDGGAIFTDDDELAHLIRSYAVHGAGSTKYDNVRVGMNSRLDALQAAVLDVKLDAFVDHELDDANRVARRYAALLAGHGIGLPLVPDGLSSSWAQYTVRLPLGTDRADLRGRLEACGIPTMVYYARPLHAQLAFADACLCPDGCPTSARLCKTVLSLPMGPYLPPKDQRRVTQALASCMGQ